MKKIFAIFSALTKSWLRSKTGVFFSFLFPVMLLLIFGTIFSGNESAKYTLYIQNFDLNDGKPTALTTAFIDALKSTGAFDIKDLAPEVDVPDYIKKNPSFSSYRILIISEGFQQKAIDMGMSIKTSIIIATLGEIEQMYSSYLPKSDLENIMKGKEALKILGNFPPASGKAEISLLTSQGDTATPVIRGIIDSVAQAFNNQLIGAQGILNITSQPLVERTLRPVDYYLPGYIAAFIMTNGIIGATSTISEYRRNGVVKRLAATPLPKSAWILGNILQQTLLAFILTGIMIVFGRLVFGARAIPDVYASLLILIGAIAFCSVGMVLGGVLKDVEAAAGAGNAIAFPMMFLSGAFWPVEMMPKYLQTFAKFLPLYYFNNGLRNIMIYRNLSSIATPFLVLGTFAIVFIGLAMKITKWKEL